MSDKINQIVEELKTLTFSNILTPEILFIIFLLIFFIFLRIYFKK